MPGHFINHIFTAVVEQEVLENLPPPLAKRLVEELYRTQVNQVPMFNGMQEEIVVRIGAPQAGGSRGFF